MSCKRTAECPLYPRLQAGAAIWKVMYCDGICYRQCERYRAQRDGRFVPANLLPNGDRLASLDKRRLPTITIHG